MDTLKILEMWNHRKNRKPSFIRHCELLSTTLFIFAFTAHGYLTNYANSSFNLSARVAKNSELVGLSL